MNFTLFVVTETSNFVQLFPSLLESLQVTLQIVREMVEAHFAFRATDAKEDEIQGKVKVELKGGLLNVPLIENIVIEIFFTANNPWKQPLIYRFDQGVSLEMFGLMITMVSDSVSNIPFYIHLAPRLE